MNQVPCTTPAPVYPQYAPVQQPNYNAVKIDIINPSAGRIQPQYAQPTAPLYNYPQAPIYNYPQAQTVPCQPIPQCNFPSVAPQAAPVESQPAAVTPQPTAAFQQTETPVVINQQNNNAPAAPQQQPVTEQAPVVPEPQVSKPEIVPSQEVAPQVDLDGFVSKLSDTNFEGQLKAMEDIADMVNAHPDKATELVDTKIFDALNNIITFDSSKLEGPSQAQIEARQKKINNAQLSAEEEQLASTLAPSELADRNKSYALFTVAILDKLYSDEVAKLSSNVVPLTDLPSAITLVDQLKDNANPMVRYSAIEALSYLQRPEYKQDLTTLFTVAKNDQDPDVVKYAQEALSKLDQI